MCGSFRDETSVTKLFARHGGWATLPGRALAGISTGTACGDASPVAKLQSATRSAALPLTVCCRTQRNWEDPALTASLPHKHGRAATRRDFTLIPEALDEKSMSAEDSAAEDRAEAKRKLSSGV